MSHRVVARAALVVALVWASFVPPSEPGAWAAEPSANASLVNKGIVELETSGSSETAARIAADIVRIVDDGATRRVVPIIGKGPLQNLTDLRFLRGIDVAIVQSDALNYAREKRLVPGIESLTYIAKLYNEELHLLARSDIKTITDLSNQTVNVDLRGSGTAVTASRLFELLQITVTMTTDNQEVALQRLRKGEIAALALVAVKPAPLFRDLKASDGLHLLNIPLTATVTGAYAPTRITVDDYPGLVAADQPAESIAVGSLLMAADLRMIPERYRNVANFVETFFAGYQTLLAPGYHPKWQEVNIAASVPGWVRYPPAEQWLQRNMQVATATNPDAMKALFSRFVDQRRQAGGGMPLSAEDKDTLFQQFEAWQRGQAR
jgi:TRAP-type uncharacterized transport system substrate-binding protein